MKFIMLINVKMPTIVGILTFMSMMNTTFEKLIARKVFILIILVFISSLKFLAQLSLAYFFYNHRPDLGLPHLARLI